MEWKNLFREIILQRGWDYYTDGHVEEILKTDEGYNAVVSGLEDYDIKIGVQKGAVTNMTCSCPYADEGNYCKHIAAVLYEIEELGEPQKLKKDTKEEDAAQEERQLKALLYQLDEKKLKRFVQSYFNRDEMFRLQFKLRFEENVSEKDMINYKKRIDKIIRDCKDKYGFVNYYGASDLHDWLMEFIRKFLYVMLECHKYDAVFDLTEYMIMELLELDIDDSDGELTILTEACCDLIRNVLIDSDSLELKRRIFDWLCRNINQVNEYMAESLEDILMECFTEDIYTNDKLEFADQMIEEYENREESWTSQYHMGRWVVFRVNMMYLLGNSQDEVNEYQERYWKLPEVRELYIEHCIKTNEYEKAIEVLVDSKELDKSNRGLVKKYRNRLVDLYTITGQTKLLQQELHDLIINDRRNEPDNFIKLKSTYEEEEWLTVRETIFDEIKDKNFLNALFYSENLPERIISNLKEWCSLNELYQYEDKLIEEYSDELLDIYKAELERMEPLANSRKDYKELVKILKRMQKYPSGKELVGKIGEEWRMKYARRTAMMDELNKLLPLV